MQGFYVHTDSAMTLTFTDAMRTVTNTSIQTAYFKSNKAESGDSIKIPVIRISAVNVKYQDKSDEAIIYFEPALNNEQRITNNEQLIRYSSEYDATKMMNTITEYPNLYIVSDSLDLSLKALPLSILDLRFTIYDFSVPLVYKVNEIGKYTINAEQILNFPDSVHIYLVDKKMSTEQDLTVEPIYTCNITPDEQGGRFYIQFRKTEADNVIDNQNLKDKNQKFDFKIYPNPSDGQNINILIRKK